MDAQAYNDCLNNPATHLRAGYTVPAPAYEDSLPATVQVALPPNPRLPYNTPPTLYILAFEHVTDDTPAGHWEVTYTSCKPPYLTT